MKRIRIPVPSRRFNAALAWTAGVAVAVVVGWMLLTLSDMGARTAHQDARVDAAVATLEDQQAALEEANARLKALGEPTVPVPTVPPVVTEEPGPQGIPGIQGLMGPPGPPGPVGATGPAGDPGPRGLRGVEGDPGVTGATGETGATGAQGEAGPQGPAGADGQDGQNGADGKDGVDGASALPFTFSFTIPGKNPAEPDVTYTVTCTVDGCTVS